MGRKVPGTVRPINSLSLAGELAVAVLGLHVVAVGPGDQIEGDLLGTRLVAFAVIRARPEEHLHGLDHRLGPLPAFGLSLRKQVHVLELGAGEQLGLRRLIKERRL